jgi:hypothetical protein
MMTNDLHLKINAIDPIILTDVVRSDQRSPLFEISDWSVDRLSDQGIINPEGLWLFRGHGYDDKGPRPWSVVLKIIEPRITDVPPSDLWYWKRELLLAESGLLECLPGPVRAPQCYRVEESPDTAWLWLEHIENNRPGQWGLDDYAFAAHQLGKWNGACAAEKQAFEEPWLARRHYLSWYRNANPEQDFQFPLNQKYITGKLRERYQLLWADRSIFYDTLDALPKSFTHLDSQRRNLLIRKGMDGQDELVLIDWAVCGMAPLGTELNFFTGMSAALFAWPPSAVAELDAVAFESYLQGLRESGWTGNAAEIRLAFTSWMAVWLGVVFPNITALWCTPDFRSFALQQFGYAEEELFLQWLHMFSFALDCADEARHLMHKLNILKTG